MIKFNSKNLKFNQSIDNKNNVNWWNNNPMNYDWEKLNGDIKGTKDYFEYIDNIFGKGHSLINNPLWPKDKILKNFLNYSEYNNKDVLEIGCGLGLVAATLAKSGAKLEAIDATDNAVKMTRLRFEINNLNGNIKKMDAENLKYNNSTFDYVVSWGVIHHSGNMEKIVANIHKVLKPNGEAYIMIYNKNSLRYRWYCFFWLGIFKLKFLKLSFDEIVGSITDGYIARHLNEREAKKLMKDFKEIRINYSDEVNTILLYLLGPLNRFSNFIPKKIKIKIEKFLAIRFGWYMQITVKK